MKTILTQFADKYGFYIVGGLIGAIVQSIRTKMTIKQFAVVLGVSSFVGFCTGIVCKNYLSAPDEVVFVACSVSGVFAQELLAELKELIEMVSEIIKSKFLKNKNGNDYTN